MYDQVHDLTMHYLASGPLIQSSVLCGHWRISPIMIEFKAYGNCSVIEWRNTVRLTLGKHPVETPFFGA